MKNYFNIHVYNWISRRDKAFLARQLAIMLQAGLALPRVLEVIIKQTTKARVKKILEAVLSDLEAGKPFSTAIAKHEVLFDRFFVAIVQSGEASGKLDIVLNDLADQLERENKFFSEIRGALIYPLFIVVTLLAVGFFISIYVMPDLTRLFQESGVSLPWTTSRLIAITGFISQFWYIILLGLTLLLILGHFYRQTDSGRLLIDNWKIRAPGLGGLSQEIYMVRFSRGLEILTKSGIPIIEAINIVSKVMDNKVYEASLQAVNEELKKGIPMSVPLAKDSAFPIIIAQMVGVGEKTGQLESTLRSVGDFFHTTSSLKIKSLSAIFEPMLIVILGLGVAFVVFSVIMPIYNLAGI